MVVGDRGLVCCSGNIMDQWVLVWDGNSMGGHESQRMGKGMKKHGSDGRVMTSTSMTTKRWREGGIKQEL